MDLAGPPLSLRDEYAGLGAAPTALCLERLLNRLDLPALEQGPHWNPVNSFTRKHLAEALRSFTAWPCARDGDARNSFVISFAHCLWLVARPALDWIAQAPDDDASCHWTPRLNQCVALLHLPFVGVDDDGQAQQVQHMTELAVILLKKHLDVDVDQQSLHATMMPLLDRGLPATGMAVYVVLLSFSAMESIIGRSLHDQLIRCLLAEAANLPLPKSLATLETSLKRELVQQLALQTSLKQELDLALQTSLNRDIVQRQTSGTPTKRSRTHTSRDTALSDKTAIVRTILVNKIALQHMVTCFLDADRLRHQLLRQPPDQADPLTADHLYSRQSIAKHMLLLDSALDSVLAKQIEAWRAQDPDAFGVALATDESPPSQNRFGGYRFQVTMVYIIRWRPMASWNASETPPLDVEPRLLDICHCPRKDGPSVMQVVDKQLARVGLMRYDVKSMVGDGGAENEGMLKGMHVILETDVDGYVRRRCLGHVAWRVADAIIAEIPDYHAVKGLCEYLHKGVTWQRLQVLAATPLVENGLGLFNEGSRGFFTIFGTAPGTIVDGRPEGDMKFLQWLGGKEKAGARCAPEMSSVGIWLKRHSTWWRSWEASLDERSGEFVRRCCIGRSTCTAGSTSTETSVLLSPWQSCQIVPQQSSRMCPWMLTPWRAWAATPIS